MIAEGPLCKNRYKKESWASDIRVRGLQCASLRAEKTESLTGSKMDFTEYMSEIFGETKVWNSTWLQDPGESFQTHLLMSC